MKLLISYFFALSILFGSSFSFANSDISPETDSVINLDDFKSKLKNGDIVRPVLRLGVGGDVLGVGDFEGLPARIGLPLGVSGSAAIRIMDTVDIGCETDRFYMGEPKLSDGSTPNAYGNENICFIQIDTDKLGFISVDDSNEEGERTFLKVGFGELKSTLGLLGYDSYSIGIVKEHGKKSPAQRFGFQVYNEVNLTYRDFDFANDEQLHEDTERWGNHVNLNLKVGVQWD